jgi:phosphatidylinositol N-acetylglucosaminyltransferase subunit C
VKQRGFPDNYTDTDTFLDHLQLNPRLRPYDFWPLVVDATVIVQHVCSVTIFVCAYAGIYQDRLSPTTVVTWGTVVTLAGWVLWDHWMSLEELWAPTNTVISRTMLDVDEASSTSSGTSQLPAVHGQLNGHANGHATSVSKPKGLKLSLSTSNLAANNAEPKTTGKHGQSLSKSSLQSVSPIDPLHDAATTEPFPPLQPTQSRPNIPYSPTTLPPTISPRNQARLKTFKSALLIYFALLGLSPILKSLTKSTSSDSIWALATWLLMINIFFFDYRSLTSSKSTTSSYAMSHSRSALNSRSAALGGTVAPSASPPRAPPFPSSLSTNAGLMASTVLASRLPSTSSVFSLTLFSIQVFGLFPVFRRHLRSVSLPLHVLLSTALILLSTSSLNLILSQSYTHTYGDCGYCLAWLWHVTFRGVLGIVLFGGTTVFVMGACSWWLIGLQRYKNVVIGPWDTAKPVLANGYGRRGTVTD